MLRRRSRNGSKNAQALQLSRRFSSRTASLEALENRLLLATLELAPSKDNTLFENPTGSLSSGIGELFAGRTGNRADTLVRRGLMAFDLSAIPAGATVSQVSLDLAISLSAPGSNSTDMSLHKLMADWGEGTSRGLGAGGAGGPATNGDATWLHRSFASSTWSTPGGDFEAAASGTASVGTTGTTATWSTAGMVADVQSWVDTPSSNFGWILIGDESTIQNARRFNSKDRGGTAPKLTVTYSEPATLSVSIAADSISEGAGAGATTATVTRTGNTDSALVVNLASSDTSEVAVPTSVTILAGQTTSPAFNLDAVDDDDLDGTQSVTITASATDFPSATDTVDVTDDEVGSLSVAIVANSISEAAGAGATTATVSRSGSTANALLVTLSSSDVSEATVPASVTIPAGQASSLPFDLDAQDDAVVDGTQSVTISATAAAHTSGSDSVDVTDFEQLTVTLSRNSISERGSTTGKVTRTDPAGDLVVNLSSDDVSEATVPVNVTIPSGQTSVFFDVTAVDDFVDDGTQQAILTASATGYVAGNASLDVTDDDTTILVTASKDNSLYEDPSGALSNGKGDFLFVGRNGRGEARRTVLAFDLTSAPIPQGAEIGAVALELLVTQFQLQNSTTVSLHTLTRDWGEGASDASGSEGRGAPAATGDATWLHTLFDTDTWTTPGGDFEAAAKATASIAEIGATPRWSSAEMVADVEAWLESPTVNFGWALVGDESSASTALKFASKDNTNDASPQLSITYSEPLNNLFLAIDKAEISEDGGVASATVTRPDTNGELTVELVSSDAGEATITASVVIADGQATSDPITITAVDDAVLDGSQTVSFTASAEGFDPGSGTLEVADNETTLLRLDGDKLVIEDVNGANTDDKLTLSIDGSDLVVRDPQNSLATEIPSASGSGTGEIRIPVDEFPGGIVVDAQGGQDVLALADTIDNGLASRLTFLGGADHDSLELAGANITLDVSQLSEVNRVDLTGSGDNVLIGELASVLANAEVGAAPLAIRSGRGDTFTFDTGWSIPETMVDSGSFVRVMRKEEATLHIVGPMDWQNPVLPLDVSADGIVVPRDALLIINELNDPLYTDGGRLADATSVDPFPLSFFDVVGNGFAAPGDATRIIDFLNGQLRSSGEGELGRHRLIEPGEATPQPLPSVVSQDMLAAAGYLRTATSGSRATAPSALARNYLFAMHQLSPSTLSASGVRPQQPTGQTSRLPHSPPGDDGGIESTSAASDALEELLPNLVSARETELTTADRLWATEAPADASKS